MREPERKSVPVDPKVPEHPVDLLRQAVQYLIDESARWSALASDAHDAKTPYAQSVLVARLDERIGDYRARGLQALMHIADQVTAFRAAAEAAMAQPAPDADGHGDGEEKTSAEEGPHAEEA